MTQYFESAYLFKAASTKGASRVDMWVTGSMDVHEKGPSIFLIFNYLNRQDMLILIDAYRSIIVTLPTLYTTTQR